MKKTLRKSGIRELNEKIKGFGVEISKKDKVEVLDDTIVFVNEKQFFILKDNLIIPSLKLLLEIGNVLKKVVVDMGAVKFVTSGADIMKPGIVEIDEEIDEEEIVAIIDEKNKKPLAVGQAMYSGDEMKKMTSGKVIKSLHFVGDEYWNIQ